MPFGQGLWPVSPYIPGCFFPSQPIRNCLRMGCEGARSSATVSTVGASNPLPSAVNETLEAMAEAIFRDWFVDFGPTRRQVAGATDPIQIMGGLTPDPEKAATLAPLFPPPSPTAACRKGGPMSALDAM